MIDHICFQPPEFTGCNKTGNYKGQYEFQWIKSKNRNESGNSAAGCHDFD